MNQLPAAVQAYAQEIERLGLRVYQPSFDADYLFLRWWMTLCENGDIERLILKGSRKLSAFYQVFAPPTVTLYTLSRTGEIDLVVWVKPASSAPDERTAFTSLWRGGRANRKQYDSVRLIYSMIFEVWPAIMGATWQPELLALHQKMGYDVIGTMPNTYGQEMVYLVYLTKEKFTASRFYRAGERRK